MTDPSRSTSGAGSACPDVDTLADYQAGVLDEQTAAEIAAHVAADPRCQQVLAALDATVAQLRSMPPVTMPDDVVQRIHAALAAEAERVGAALLAIGTRGRGGFRGMMLGSVSHGVLHAAKCPVAIVR